MRYELERRDLKIKGTRPRVRLIAETPSEVKMLDELEQELHSEFGNNYVLLFSGHGPDPRYGGLSVLEYVVLKKD